MGNTSEVESTNSKVSTSKANANNGNESEGMTSLFPPPLQFKGAPNEPKEEDGEEPEILGLFGLELKTSNQLGALYSYYAHELQVLAQQIGSKGVLPPSYDMAKSGILDVLAPHYLNLGEKELTPQDLEDLKINLKDIEKTKADLDKQLLIQKRNNLEHNYSALRELANVKIDAKTKEAYRLAFLNDDTEATSKIGTLIFTLNSVSSEINGKIGTINKVLQKVNKYIDIDDAVALMSNIGELTGDLAGAFGKISGLYNKVTSAMNILSKLSQNNDSYTNAKNGIALMSEGAGAVYGYIPGAGWYGDYITSSVNIISGQMDYIKGKSMETEGNFRKAFDSKKKDPAYYSHSPGGAPVFLFMQKVMRARSPQDIKTKDINKNITSFFEDQNEGKINKSMGKSKDNKMPVDHGIFNDTLDKEAFKEYIFKNKKQMWYMLYGSEDIEKATAP
ncbi:hypothetical protein [Portibacter lacus]|uniref:Uncharacterized protein n=1 Tax=Portibacter lacus TaxID=1099794 RepID=A0AA37SND8_9BACT|nr:hypothetical protein [Portibacter lacus]GLR16997.1 hypothetical protein GCM10007940_16120 [Portibacter lacus]